MKLASAMLGRLAVLIVAAVIGSSGAHAQTVASQATSSAAPASQAAPSPATASAPATPPPATAAKPAAAIAPNAPAAAAGTVSATSQSIPASTGRAYEVEIVIFRAKVALGQPENWAAETSAAAIIAGGEAATGSGAVGKLLSVLPSSDYRLASVASQLRSSGAYLPVAHAAWVQTASAWGTHGGFSLQSLGIDVPGLSGVIFLERGEFLHLGMTLDYTMHTPPPGLNAPAGTTFVMNETRRVRFYQRNYYDHPAFGVIALVTPARGSRPPGR